MRSILRTWAGALLMANLALSAPAADLVQAESRIVAVTVMADRAEVTRAVTADVPAGESLIAVEGLLPGLDEHSLRAEAAEGATLQGLGSDVIKRPRPAPGVPGNIRARLDAIRSRMAAIDATVLGLRRQTDLVRRYRTRTLYAIARQAGLAPEKLPGGELQLDQWDTTLDELWKQELELLKRTRTREVERFRLEEEQKQRKHQWKAHASPKLVEVRRALVGVSAPEAGRVSFRLLYRVAGPSWRVRYDLRLDPETATLRLEAYGMVSQKTGEDWTDIDLVLSTRLPSGGLRAPPPPTLVLEGRETHAVRSELAAVQELVSAAEVAEEIPAPEPDGEKPVAGPDAPGAPPKVPAWAKRKGLDRYVALRSSLAGERYHVKGKATIPGSGLPQQVPILQARVKASVVLEAVPRYTNTVYRRVRVHNDSGATLQPGRASLFLGGDMVGVTTTPAVLPGQDLVLSFGAVPGLAIQPVRVANQTDTTTATAPAAAQAEGRQAYRFAYRWQVQNRTDQDVQLRMLEAVPASDVDKIQVAVDEKRSSPHTALADGILRFPLEVPATGRASVDLRYTISLPAEMRLF